MKVIGITGGVGSGKSEVLRLMEEEYGCTVIKTDDVAKQLCEPGEESYQNVIEAFGEGVLDEDGQIDRARLSEIVFKDESKREILNHCIHPAVYRYVRRRIAELRMNREFRLVAVEAALVKELKEVGVCDDIWYISSRPEIRRERLKQSRGYDDEKIESLFASQLPEEAFLKECDAVIDNNGALEEVRRQLNLLWS